jgi:hypothetical protein
MMELMVKKRTSDVHKFAADVHQHRVEEWFVNKLLHKAETRRER